MRIFNENGSILPDVQEVLYELGNVGLGVASVSIGRMIGMRMHLGIPNVLPAETSGRKTWADAVERMGILTEIRSGIKGYILLLMEEELADSVMDKAYGEGGKETEGKESSPDEIGRLLSVPYLNAVCQYSGTRVAVKPVWVRIGQGQALIRDAIEYFCVRYHRGVVVDTAFSMVCEDGRVKENAGRVLMVLEEDSVGKVIGPLMENLA